MKVIYKNKNLSNKGQITIYLCLIISVVLIFFLTILEGIRIYMGRSRADISTTDALYSIMADYNSELFKRYYLIALDVEYGGRGQAYLEERVIDYLEYNLNSSSNSDIYIYDIKDVFLVDYTSITDNNLSNFKAQIKEYVKTEGLVDVTTDILGRMTEVEDTESISGEVNTEKSYSDIEDPRDIISRILDNGILGYVIPMNARLSNQTIKMDELPSNNKKEYKELSDYSIDTSFMEKSNINVGEQLSDFNNSLESLGEENIQSIIYAMNCFGNYSSPAKYDTVLEYEVEYLIAGKDNDYDNLEAVANRILFYRYISNYMDIQSDEGKKGAALLLATGLSVATGTEVAVDVYKEIILASWAYLDSLDDVRDIMSGDTVDNLCYEDYLIILLAVSINKDNQYYRMLDLIEVNIGQYESDFQIENCAYVIKLGGYLEFDRRFLSRNNQKYIYYFDKEISY